MASGKRYTQYLMDKDKRIRRSQVQASAVNQQQRSGPTMLEQMKQPRPGEEELELDLFPKRVSRWARSKGVGSWPPKVITQPWGSERTGVGVVEAVLDSEVLKRQKLARALGYPMPIKRNRRRNALWEKFDLSDWLTEKRIREQLGDAEQYITGPLEFLISVPRDRMPMPVLPDDSTVTITRAVHSQYNRNEVVGKGDIKRVHMWSLKDGVWLNDEVINVYLSMISERSDKIHVMSTQFYRKYQESGYAGVRRWTKSVDVFSKELLLFPIHLGTHWTLAVVDFKLRLISYYDSMRHENDHCLFVLISYLSQESQDKSNLPFDPSVWKFVNRKDSPRQQNMCDCGVFLCTFAEYIARGAAFDFDQQEMPYFRRKIVYEIVKGSLLL